MEHLSKEFWDERYATEDTGWDLGAISTPLKEYVDQLTDRSIKVLIPGCGKGYEAEYMHQQGFSNVHILDLSALPLEDFQKRVRDFPATHLHQGDFFQHSEQYDLVLEQTLFCAIDPSLRNDYARKMDEILRPSGKLVGLLFDKVPEQGPPYGGNEDEYRTYFQPYFANISMERCYNSIPPRHDRELFIRLRK